MQQSKKVNIKMSEDMRKAIREAAAKMQLEAIQQEYDFMLEFLTKALNGMKPTAKRMQRAGIVRFYNPDTGECWYERKGKVITPSFFFKYD